MTETLLWLVAASFYITALVFMIWLVFMVPGQMAVVRGRSRVGWVVVSLVFSSFAAIFLLWLLGSMSNTQADN